MTEVHDHHGRIFEWIRKGGYPALFAVLLSCGVGVPLPEDIPLITAGILVQKGHFNLAMACIAAWCGIIGGDCILYSLGRKFGSDVTKMPVIGRHINQKRLVRIEEWFKLYGIWVVAIGRMFAGVRGAMVLVAGTTRFNFLKFIIADGLAAVVSGGAFLFIGYKFAEHSDELEHLVHRIKGGMLLGGVVLVIAIAAWVWWRKRGKNQPAEQSPIQEASSEIPTQPSPAAHPPRSA